MLKKLIAFLLIILTMTSFSTFAADENVYRIYVALNGMDSASGDINNPFATVDFAKEHAKKYQASNPNTPIEIIFRGGEYRLDKSISLNSSNSGTKNAPITYKGMENEKVVLKGSKIIDINGFSPVTDEAMKKRFKPEVVNLIGEIDLKQYGITTIAKYPTGQSGGKSTNGYQMFLNDVRQTLARWPNQGFAKSEKVVDTKNGVIQFKEMNLLRWGNAKPSEVYIGGYFKNQYSTDFFTLSKIIAEERQIQLAGNFDLRQGERRVYFKNLAEELDVPGEWYINSETMKLYYMPEHKLSDEILEIASLRVPFFNMDGVEYVNFENLEFSQSCSNFFQIKNCHNLGFRDNYFRNCGQGVIYDSQRNNVTYEWDKAVPSSNIIFEDNLVVNIAAAAIDLSGGSHKTLEKGNHLIQNNYFYNVGHDAGNYAGAIIAAGVGFEIKNNVMHGARGCFIQTNGNDMDVTYNEIYEGCKDVHDAGLIYSGRSQIKRGVNVSNNYIHDGQNSDPSMGDITVGIYLDDNLGGWTMNNNIIENFPRGIFLGGGCDNDVNDNIFIDCSAGLRLGYYVLREALITEGLGIVEQYPVYLQKYPELIKQKDAIGKYNYGNVINDNLLVNSALDVTEDATKSGDAEAKNNLSVADIKDVGFEDFENRNYRLKEDNKIFETHPDLKETVDVDKIGLSDEMEERMLATVNNDFTKTFPRNGESNIAPSSVTFMWQRSNLYDRYVITIAKDKDLKDIVVQKEVFDPFFVCENILEAGNTTYYWDVTAIDSSMNHYPDKKSVGVPYVFTTTTFEETEKMFLENELAISKATIDETKIDTNVGGCSEETLNTFKEAFYDAKMVYDNRYTSQKEIDKSVNELSEARRILNENKNKGFVSLNDRLANPNLWSSSGELSTFKDGVLTVADDFVCLTENIPSYEITSFEMMPDKDFSMIAITLRLPMTGIIWKAESFQDGYTIIIKPNLIEYQRYKAGKGGIIASVENKFIKGGEWNKIDIGTVGENGGIRTVLRVNGEEALNFFDDTGTIVSEGRLQFENYNVAKKLPLLIKGVESVSEYNPNVLTGRLKTAVPKLAEAQNLEFKAINDSLVSENVSEGDILQGSFKIDTSKNPVIALRQSADKEENYQIKITDSKIMLYRLYDEKLTPLVNVKNEYFKDLNPKDILVGAYPTDSGMRIMLYSDEKKIIDYTDILSKHKGTQLSLSEAIEIQK